ncbi:uncharacterized protein B0H64DRAFT_327573, partial [Chaetomium fimeti]
PLVLPASTYASDISSDLTEPLHWYGMGKLHPSHLGDQVERGRYTIVHKLDHDNHTLSWLVRDNMTATWRRLDILHESEEMMAPRFRAAAQDLEVRAELGSPAEADRRGLAVAFFTEPGPNGYHVHIVWPLHGAGNFFRSGVPFGGDDVRMDVDWFVRECAKLRRGVPPACFHDITAQEMLAILGRPRVIMLDAELARLVTVTESIAFPRVPRYLVLRPERIVDISRPDNSLAETEAETETDADE